MSRTIEVYTLGNPGVFSIPEGCPTPNTERLSYEISQMLYLLNAQGFVIEQSESGDLDTVGGQIDTLVADFKTWQDSVILYQDGGGPLVKYTPPVLSGILPGLLTAVLAGNWAVAVVYLVQYGIQVLLSRLFESGVKFPQDLDVSDLVSVLQACFQNADNMDKALLLEIRETLENILAGWGVKMEVGNQEVVVTHNDVEVIG